MPTLAMIATMASTVGEQTARKLSACVASCSVPFRSRKARLHPIELRYMYAFCRLVPARLHA